MKCFLLTVMTQKQAGPPRGKPACFTSKARKPYWRAAGVAALAMMGDETRLAALVLL